MKCFKFEALLNAFEKSRKDIKWKKSVNNFASDLTANLLDLQQELQDITYNPQKMIEFILRERGKIRYIKAPIFRDRIVQKTFCDNVLLPKCERFLIYDNGASLKGKGITFARQRFHKHLKQAYKKFNGDAYVITADFSKYFDNIQHQKALKIFSQFLNEEEMFWLKLIAFDNFKVDVSYMNDEEYEHCLETKFNLVDYESTIDKSLRTKEKFMEKSVGIGNQCSQIIGLLYAYRIDNFCKIVKSCKYYGRYMDDIYAIVKTKEEAKQLLKEIQNISKKELGIEVNMKKTQIHNINNTISFLKFKYNFINGKIRTRIHSSTFKRAKRKITIYKKLLEQRKMTVKEVFNNYNSWYQNFKRYCTNKQKREISTYFRETIINNKEKYILK